MENFRVQENLERVGLSQGGRCVTALSLILLIALFFSLSLPLAYTIGGAVFAILGLFFLGRRFVFKTPIIEKTFVGKLPLFFIFFAVAGMAINAWHSAGLGSYEEYIPFLWAPLIFLAIADSFIDRRILWLGAATGAVLAFCVAIYQLTHLGMERPEGFALSPITFGNNVLMLGAVGAMGRYDPPRRISNWFWYGMTMLGFVAGIATSLISQSRGGWPLILVVVPWIFLSDFAKAGTKLKIAFVAAVLALSATLYVHPLSGVNERLDSAYTGLAGWFETGKPVNESTGGRLELWRFGMSVWPEYPWLGHGEDGLLERKAELIKAGKLDPLVEKFTALHNEAIQLLVEKGLAGFVSWLVMFGAAFAAFYHASRHVGNGIRYLGHAGLVVVGGSLIFGFTDMNLMLNANRQMFVLLAMIIAALIARAFKHPHSAT